MLRKLRDELALKTNRTTDEETLLKELISLNPLLDKFGFSLSAPSNNCPVCGKPYTE
jgi:hypothetical protein